MDRKTCLDELLEVKNAVLRLAWKLRAYSFTTAFFR